MKQIHRYITAIAIVLTACYTVHAQNTKADKLREEGNLDGAILEYKKIYDKDPGNQTNTYNLACAFALTYYQADSAFKYLKNALETDNTLWALCDPDLISLIDDNRWENIAAQQLNKFQAANGKLASPDYTRQLLQLIMKDQSMNYQIDMAKKYFAAKGNAPQWYYPIAYMKQKTGEDDYQVLLKLIDQYGWPTYSRVGKLAADAPLLVINHQESEEVRKLFLPQIKDACLQGEGSCLEYAKIHDRVLVNTDQPQTYGMQFRYNEKRQLVPFPIKDPEYVDQRRAEIGLEPLKDYLKKKINYDWTVEQKTR